MTKPTRSDKFWSATISPGTTVRETAAQAHARLTAEALRRTRLLLAALKKEATQSKGADWGDVGSLAAVVENLGLAGHYAQVPELTEK